MSDTHPQSLLDALRDAAQLTGCLHKLSLYDLNEMGKAAKNYNLAALEQARREGAEAAREAIAQHFDRAAEQLVWDAKYRVSATDRRWAALQISPTKSRAVTIRALNLDTILASKETQGDE